MPRAHRHFLPGHVWHITHRCHKKEFLLKFARDRHLWRYWPFVATLTWFYDSLVNGNGSKSLKWCLP